MNFEGAEGGIVSLLEKKPSAISTAWLNGLLRLHRPPIEQVIFLRPYLVAQWEA